ncbi:MAG: glycosyltransferase family A protein [Candidatus Bathyarchaeia archaeon]
MAELKAQMVPIAIGMPVYNRAKTLPRVLDSILELDYDRRKLRLIFVDNRSSDGSFELLEEFGSRWRGGFEAILIVRERGNIPFARNRCIDLMGGAVALLFLDSDVVLKPWALKRMLELMEGADITSLQYGPPPRGRKRGPRYVSDVGMGCTLIKREVFNAIGRFDEGLPVGEDTDFCLRAVEAGFRIILDDSESLEHLGRGETGPLGLLAGSARKRAVYARLLSRRVYRRRFALYSFLDLCLPLSALASPAFAIPITAYFALQLAKSRSPGWALASTANALILPPLALIGLLESRRAGPAGSRGGARPRGD